MRFSARLRIAESEVNRHLAENALISDQLIAEVCARCHGRDGYGRGAGTFPRLAGQRLEYMTRAMRAYADGGRQSGIMAPVAHRHSGPRLMHEVRKACAWYARGLYGCNALRLEVWEAPDLPTARALCEEYFDGLMDREARGLSPEGVRATKDADVESDAA